MKRLLGTSLFRKGILFLNARDSIPPFLKLATILTTGTSRNIYYKDPSLFKTQAVVDRCVDTLAYTFDVPRAKLNIVRETSAPFTSPMQES